MDESTAKSSKDFSDNSAEEELCLEDLIFDYELVMNNPNYAAQLLNEYLQTKRPSGKGRKKEDYQSLEKAVLEYIENIQEQSISVYHNSTDEIYMYNPNESISKQFNRVLYGKLDEENGFNKEDKAEQLSKIVQEYASYTASNGGFNPNEFVKLAKKINTYVSNNVINVFAREKLTFHTSYSNGSLEFYGNRNIGGLSKKLIPIYVLKKNDNFELLVSAEKIKENRAICSEPLVNNSERNILYFPIPQKRNLWSKITDAVRFAVIGYSGFYEKAKDQIVARDYTFTWPKWKSFFPRNETQYTALGI